MDKIRVFLVDDAAAVRRLMTNALNRDPALEVVGTAADGQMALNRLVECQPDVVLLDLEMPVMDGLQTLTALRKTQPRLPVIMFSRFTQRGVEATVHALTLGADDYVPKPGDGLDVRQCIEELLIPKIKVLARRRGQVAEGSGRPSPSASSSAQQSPTGSVRGRHQLVEIVAIGASTGDPTLWPNCSPCFLPIGSSPSSSSSTCRRPSRPGSPSG